MRCRGSIWFGRGDQNVRNDFLACVVAALAIVLTPAYASAQNNTSKTAANSGKATRPCPARRRESRICLEFGSLAAIGLEPGRRRTRGLVYRKPGSQVWG